MLFKLKDPRVERTRKHLFLDIIGLALFAVLAGAQCYTEIEDFCHHLTDNLTTFDSKFARLVTKKLEIIDPSAPYFLIDYNTLNMYPRRY